MRPGIGQHGVDTADGDLDVIVDESDIADLVRRNLGLHFAQFFDQHGEGVALELGLVGEQADALGAALRLAIIA